MQITKRVSIGIRAAMKAALKSQHNFTHGAAILQGSNVIAIGFNRYIYDFPTGQKSGKPTTIHAEANVIGKAISRGADLSRCDIFICRLNNSGNLMLSAPCPQCKSLITKNGISTIYYSTYDGWDIDEQ